LPWRFRALFSPPRADVAFFFLIRLFHLAMLLTGFRRGWEVGTAAVDPSVVIGGMVCNGVGFFFLWMKEMVQMLG
jgi:hypothetical protein